MDDNKTDVGVKPANLEERFGPTSSCKDNSKAQNWLSLRHSYKNLTYRNWMSIFLVILMKKIATLHIFQINGLKLKDVHKANVLWQ